MDYAQQVLKRLLQPGTLLLVIGMVAVYTSKFMSGRLFSGSEKADIVIKIIGCVIALVGTLMIFL